MPVVKWIFILFLLSSSVFAAHNFYEEALKSKENKFNGETVVLKKETRSNSFFKDHGLMFFFSSQCPHCHSFAPVVRKYADSNQAEVLALSFDNKPLPSFEKFLPATKDFVSIAFGNNPINYPALFVINPKTRAIYPVSSGSFSEAELQNMMDGMIEKIKVHERGEG